MNATVAGPSNKGDWSHEQWMHAEQFSDRQTAMLLQQ
jgi:hypothetical protein